MRLDVVNTDAPDGLLKVRLVPDGAALTFGPQPEQFELAPGAKAVFEVPVTAQNVGDPEFDIILTMPDGRELRQTLTLPVRMNDPVVASTRRFALGGGDTFDFTSDVFADMQPGTGSAIISAGALARFDVPGILGTLERYPYGCSEQVTSKALPLLYLSGIAGEIGLGDQKAIRARVDAAIAQLMTRQSSNGAFGLWQAGSGDFWLDSYITDFLSRARAERFEVPDRAFRLAMDNLRNRINYAPDFDSGGEDIAFALMVLAREGAASMGDLRYYADVKSTAFATPLAAAQLGAALAYYGDQPRADAMFARAARMLAVVDDGALIWRADYGTALRDTAGVLALATRAGSDVVDPSALGALLVDDGAPLSTQESAWSLLAAHALVETPENSGLLVDGAPASSPFVKVLDSQTQSSGLAISTVSHRSEDLTLTTFGVPSSPPPAGGTGYAIGRSYYNLDGVPIDEQDLSVGDRFVIVLQVDPFEAFSARLIVNDPLPAGIEIDNPALLRSGDVRALDWLQPSEVEHAEFRSDRFLAAVDLRSAGTVTLAYGARAVSPGSFHRPAASVEDMYRPRYRAHTDTGRVDIAE